MPRAFVAVRDIQRRNELPSSIRATDNYMDSRRTDCSFDEIAAFEFSIDGVGYFLTYVPPSSSAFSGAGFCCQLRADVRLKIPPSDVSAKNCKEPVGAIIRLKEGNISELEDWATQLDLLADEARESIRREGVLCETWFSFALENSIYLFCYMRQSYLSPPLDERLPVLAVDKMHKKFKAIWDATVRIPCVLTRAMHF